MNISSQYWYEQRQPQRKNFISRNLSYHGNTVTTLSLSGHPARRKPFDEILQHENYHRVSPAYAKRFRYPEETEEQYVERLRQELEDKFVELGPDTVIGCKSSPTLSGNGRRLRADAPLKLWPKPWSERLLVRSLHRKVTSKL